MEELRVGAAYWLAFLLAGMPRHADRKLLIPAALLVSAGLSVMYHIAPFLVLKQVQWLVLAALIYVVVAHPRMAAIWHGQTLLFAVTTVALMVVTAIIGIEKAGSRAWLGGQTFATQPVEFAKIQLILLWGTVVAGGNAKERSSLQTYASALSGLHGRGRLQPWAFALSAIFMLCALWQRDIGPLLVLGITALFWSISHGVRWRAVFLQLSGLLALVVTGMLFFHHIRVRIIAWVRPWDDPFGFGYQPIQSLFALARGGILGGGWESLSAVRLPAAATDLPMIVFAEAVGLGGVLLVLLCYGLLISRSLQLAWQPGNALRRPIGLGLTTLLASQVLIILAGSVRLIPLAGVTLPFVSYGGSSLLATFLLLGLLSALQDDEAITIQHGAHYKVQGKRFRFPLQGVFLGFGAIFFAVMYWGVFQGPKLKAHPLHLPAAWADLGANRAGIKTRNGESLTSTSGNNKPIDFDFPYLAHVVGYRHPQYGLSGLEAAFDATLVGRNRADSSFGERLRLVQPQPVYTTVDARVQAAIEAAWPAGNAGAIVAYDPWTGDILGLLSSPVFDMGQLEDSIHAPSNEAPMLNRALQGRYPPGSIWKLVTLAAALEAGVVSPQTLVHDAPAATIGGIVIRNAGGRAAGTLSLPQALAVSSNVIFARIASQMGADAFRLTAKNLGLGGNYGLPLPVTQGSMGNLNSAAAIAAAGIGQGEVLVTPLEMAVMVGAIANGGFNVPPHIVFEANQTASSPHAPGRVMGSDTAILLQQGMRNATEFGTAAGAVNPALLAGKTGTAENPHGAPHAWFVGFAPAAQPALVIVVLVENGGSGAAAAAPIAAAIVRSVFGTSSSLPVQ